MTTKLAHQATAAVVLLAAFLAGCSKPNDVVKPEVHVLTHAQADSVAATTSDLMSDYAPLGMARALFLTPAVAADRTLHREPRPASRGRAADDTASIEWQMTCYGLDGREVDWATVSFDSIDRIVYRWEYLLNTDGQDSGWTIHNHMHSKGMVDFRGFSSRSTEFRLDGASRDSLDLTCFNESTAVESRSNWAIGFDGVRWGKDFAQHPYPLGGTIIFSMDLHWRATGENPLDVTVAAEIRYNGTRFAVMIVDGYRYQLDLETGETVRLHA